MAENTLTVNQLNSVIAPRLADAQVSAANFLLSLLNLVNVQLTNSFNVDSLIPDAYDPATTPNIEFPVFSATRPLVNVNAGLVPEVPALTTFSEVVDVTTPDLTAVAPVLSLPALPSSTLPTAPSGAPDFISPDIPSAPAITLPTVPTFAALTLPEAPSVNLPSFAGTLPTDELVVPTNSFSFAEAAYESALLDPLRAKLLYDLTNGGYGIDTNDEQALFQRTRDREAAAAMLAIDEAGRTMAARGFPLPPGELSIAIDRAQQEFQDKVSAANREITLERSRLFVENRQFTIQQTRDVEQMMINFHNAVQERGLNIAKATLEASLSIYDALVKRYSARLDAYRAEATAFAERIRGELAKAEIYRTQIQAAGLQVEMQKSLVDVYRAQLDGINASVNIYRTQMEAARIRADIERQKLEAWKAQIDGYTAQVQAKVAEFNMYRAGVDGQVARMNIYESEVRAYGTQVAAAKTRSDTQLSILQAQEAQARVKLEFYRGQIEAFKAGTQNLTDAGRLQVDLYRADVENYRAKTDGYAENAKLQQAGILAATSQNTEIARVSIENARAKLLAVMEQFRFRMEAIKYGGDQYHGVIVTTLNALQGLTVENKQNT